MADVAKFERHLHSCQVVLWLKQNYCSAADHTDRGAILKEGVYAHYVEMCRRDMPHVSAGHVGGGNLFSKAVVGKMVKRAFPHVRSRRLGVKGTIRQYYTGITRLCEAQPSEPSTTTTTTTMPRGPPSASSSPSTSPSTPSSSSSSTRSSFSTPSSSASGLDDRRPLERLFAFDDQNNGQTAHAVHEATHDWLGPVLVWAEAIISPLPSLTTHSTTANVPVYS